MTTSRSSGVIPFSPIGLTISLLAEISSTSTLEPRTTPFFLAQLFGSEIKTVPPPISSTLRVSIESIEIYRLFIDYLDIFSIALEGQDAIRRSQDDGSRQG